MSAVRFRRMVMRLRQGVGPAGGSIRLVARMASAWQVELVGAFSPDPNLGLVAEHAVTREFRLHERKWASLERSAVNSELRSTARRLERGFVDALQSAHVQGRFAEQVEETEGDILVVCEPDDPLEQLSRSLREDIRAALASGKAVMVVPRRARGNHGPIVALLRSPDDPAHAMGEELAAALGERLLTIELQPDDAITAVPARLEALSPRLVILSHPVRNELADALCNLSRACPFPLLGVAE
jgi:hypothetical protein